MYRKIVVMCMFLAVFSVCLPAHAFDGAKLVGKWRLVENARDKAGQPCPFVSGQIELTADGRLLTAGMPVVFRYKVNPGKADSAEALKRNPELKGMAIMLAMEASRSDWSKAPIVYGVEIKKNELIMKVSGYTPARYKKEK